MSREMKINNRERSKDGVNEIKQSSPIGDESNCKLSNEELIERCNQWVHKLAESGGKAWTLRVPVDFNHDPDMLFIELGKRLAGSQWASLTDLLERVASALDSFIHAMPTGEKRNYLCDLRIEVGAAIKGQTPAWASPRWVKASEILQELVRLKTIKDELDAFEGTQDQAFVNKYAQYRVDKSKAWKAAKEWLDETPAHPTAVNGDDEMTAEEFNDIAEIRQPKAAAPKVDVKTKEEILKKALKLNNDLNHTEKKVIQPLLDAMEEYANQFKSH